MDKMKNITFSQLKDYNDSNSIIFMAVIFKSLDDIQKLDEFFHEINLIPKDKHVVDIHFISDNVLGSDGRSDYLIEFDRPDLNVSPMVRLQVGSDIKWTSDFITNFQKDYKSKC